MRLHDFYRRYLPRRYAEMLARRDENHWVVKIDGPPNIDPSAVHTTRSTP